MSAPDAVEAVELRLSGIVQGVGFRPFVCRLARAHRLAGWVRNDGAGVEVHAEGPGAALARFMRTLEADAPGAARIAAVEVATVAVLGLDAFSILESGHAASPTASISPDVAVCADCLEEMRNPADRRFGYPFINCAACGPRYSIVLDLPYDRSRTTMRAWKMCAECRREFDSAADRRFHAQPTACPGCGPHCRLEALGEVTLGTCDSDRAVVERAAELLREGRVLGVKGVGGYHLVCDAENRAAVQALRERKFRKERPFAVMARDLETLRRLLRASPALEAVAASPARPIVLAEARGELPEVAPETDVLGVMLPYAPLHELLFAAGSPDVLVVTSANRSSEPIAFMDADARERLAGIADVLLVGDRPIARRVDDSVVQDTAFGPAVIRRSRGYAPAPVCRLAAGAPILALGGDLKNAVALAVAGGVLVSQHIGDLEHASAREAFGLAIQDLLAIYRLSPEEVVVAHDRHPDYASTRHARLLPARDVVPVQHHRAHVASVLAERGDTETPVIGVAFDGTGYGDDGTIWGGEFFAGTLAGGLERVGHLRQAFLPGGDAAAAWPLQAAAGFLHELVPVAELMAPPFAFDRGYAAAVRLVGSGMRTFRTSSVGRLFDTVAALLGFTRRLTYEGQAAVWLEALARGGAWREPYALSFHAGELDYREALVRVAADRRRGVPEADAALAFHRGLADAVLSSIGVLAEAHGARTGVLSGGVFQNRLLLQLIDDGRSSLPIWINRQVPANDGGLALGQAAIANFASRAVTL